MAPSATESAPLQADNAPQTQVGLSGKVIASMHTKNTTEVQ